jgi:excisionase family DNA binding protein
MKRDDITELLTLRETAKKLKVSEQTLRRWDTTGHFKAVRVGTRRKVGDRRYRSQDLEAYLRDKIKKK